MKRTLLLLVAALFIVPAILEAKEVTAANVSIEVSDDWKRNSEMEKGFSIISMYSKTGLTLGLTKEENKFNNSQKELRDYAIEGFKKSAQNAEVLDETSDRYFIVKYTSPSGYNMHALVYVVVKDGEVYKLTFTAPSQQQFNDAKDEFEKIAQTLKAN